MNHVMVDLETLGKRAGCAIISIGAVLFDETGVDENNAFYTVVSRKDCVQLGLHEDPDTLDWWSKQSEGARYVLQHSMSNEAKPLVEALTDFGHFVGPAKVWGNGADFDNAILYACYAAVEKPVPWKFWDSRCYRTLKNLYKDVPMAKRVGTHHNALDDAINQARHASAIFQAKGLR
jgi:DNA polymerase III epsilon subunit-like protein